MQFGMKLTVAESGSPQFAECGRFLLEEEVIMKGLSISNAKVKQLIKR
jgi:hypothetical protein